jgi:hypothetical protein
LDSIVRRRAEIPRATFVTVDRLLEDINRRLAVMTEAEAVRLRAVIDDAVAEVTSRVAGGDGPFARADAQAIRLQLTHLRSELTGRIADQLGGAAVRAQLASIGDMRHEVAALSEHFGRPRSLDIDTVLTVTDTSKLLVSRIARSAARRSRQEISALSSVLGSAAAQGLSFREAGRLLERRLDVEGGNADRLARTEFVHAYNLQRAEVAAAEGYGLLWNAAMYGACEICGPLDGRIADHGRAFPGGIEHPPAHPNCRCAAVLWHAEWSHDEGSAAWMQ